MLDVVYIKKKDIEMNKEIRQIDTKKQITLQQDMTANPAPLGLMGFGMTVLLNFH